MTEMGLLNDSSTNLLVLGKFTKNLFFFCGAFLETVRSSKETSRCKIKIVCPLKLGKAFHTQFPQTDVF